VTERELTDAVLELARLLGWRCAHFRPARTARGWRTAVQGDGAGFPDLVLVRGERILYRELKTERGKLRPEQEAWLSALRAAGADAGVWTEADWRCGAIESALRPDVRERMRVQACRTGA
jgi:hypothetical protein